MNRPRTRLGWRWRRARVAAPGTAGAPGTAAAPGSAAASGTAIRAGTAAAPDLTSAVGTADDGGSIMLLTLGYAALALAAIMICVSATSLYLAQKRLDALADAAALAGADGFTIAIIGDDVRADLTDAGVHAQAQGMVATVGEGATLVSAGTPDGVSARVTVALTWHPPVVSLFVPDGVPLRATATSRTALR